MPVADILRTARQRAGLTQRQLAERTGLPQPSIARIESSRADVRVGTLEILLDGCDEQLTTRRPPGYGVDRTQFAELLALPPRRRLERIRDDAAGWQRLRDRAGR